MNATHRTLAIAISLLFLLTLIPIQNDQAASTTLVQTNFDDGTWQGWSHNSGAFLRTDYKHSGGYSIRVDDTGSASISWNPMLVTDIDFYYFTPEYPNGYIVDVYNGTSNHCLMRLFRADTGDMKYFNGATTVLGVNLAKDSWHDIHLTIQAGSVTIKLDSSVIGTYALAYNELPSSVSINPQGGFNYYDDFVITGTNTPTPRWAAHFTSTPGTLGTIGTSYTYTPTCNETVTYSFDTQPAWLTWSAGTLSGTPVSIGSSPVSLKAIGVGGIPVWQNWTIYSANLKIWDGGGANNLASTAANWNLDVLPAAGDFVKFDGTSVKVCTYDLTTLAYSFTIATGYSGTITQSSDMSIGAGGFSLSSASATFTGLATKSITDSGPFSITYGTFTSGVTNLIMNGANTHITSYASSNYVLSFRCSSNVEINSGVDFRARSWTTDVGTTLTVTGTFRHGPSTGLAYTITNNGQLSGNGLYLEILATIDVTENFGIINCPAQVNAASTATANRVVTVGANSVFGSTLLVDSAHATYTCTLSTGTYTLQCGPLTLGARGVITQGTGQITCTSYTQSGASSVFTQGGAIVDSGNWDSNVGTYNNNNHPLTMTGAGKTIKMQASQTLYDWTIQAGASVQLLSDITVTHAYHNYGSVNVNGYHLNVPVWAPTWTSSPSTTGKALVAYSYTPTINETGTIVSITLPSWATFSGGHITGTPSVMGVYSFEIKATSTAGTLDVYQYWNVTVSDRDRWAPTFTNAPPTACQPTVSYSYGPTTNESSSISILVKPVWLTWSGTSLSGTPSSLGVFQVSIQATSNAGTHSAWLNYSITVVGWAPQITNSPSLTALVGDEYNYSPTANESVTWTLESSPVWAGQIGDTVIGLPDAAGSVEFHLRAVSDAGTKSVWLNWTVVVSNHNPEFLTLPIDNGTKRIWYNWTVEVSMSSNLVLDTNAFWLRLNPVTGELAGLPVEGGSFPVSIQATSTQYGTVSYLNYTLTIANWLGPSDDDSGDSNPPDDNGGTTNPGTIIPGIANEYLLLGGVALLAIIGLIVVASRRR